MGLTQPTCPHDTADLELVSFLWYLIPAPKGLPSKTPGLLNSLPYHVVKHLDNPALSLKLTPKYQLHCFPELSISTTFLCQLFPPGSRQVGIASCDHILNMLSLISALTEPVLSVDEGLLPYYCPLHSISKHSASILCQMRKMGS